MSLAVDSYYPERSKIELVPQVDLAFDCFFGSLKIDRLSKMGIPLEMPQMPDVAGDAKAAADKATKAAQEAAELAGQKTKETYDLVVPAEIDWC